MRTSILIVVVGILVAAGLSYTGYRLYAWGYDRGIGVTVNHMFRNAYIELDDSDNIVKFCLTSDFLYRLQTDPSVYRGATYHP